MGREDSCPRSRHLGLDRWGGYAEYVTVPVDNVFHMPDNLSFAEASVITRHFPTAINLLLNHANLEQNEWVLIMGAAGALGSCGVQIARHQGARVIAAAGSDSRAETARTMAPGSPSTTAGRIWSRKCFASRKATAPTSCSRTSPIPRCGPEPSTAWPSRAGW